MLFVYTVPVQIAVVSIAGPLGSVKSSFLNGIAKWVFQQLDDVSPAEGGKEEEPWRGWKAPFDASPTLRGGTGDVMVLIVPECANPLADGHKTTLLMLDTPEMRAPQR